MTSFERRTLESSFQGLTRRDRRPCQYSVYLPDHLAGRRMALDGDVAAAVAGAESGGATVPLSLRN